MTRVSLRSQEVDAIAFSTRNYRPLFPYLDELDERGFLYYFLARILGNPREMDPKSPTLPVALDNFLEISRQTGAGRAIWRYDPIVLSNKTGIDYHLKQFQMIASALTGATQRCIISYVCLRKGFLYPRHNYMLSFMRFFWHTSQLLGTNNYPDLPSLPYC